MVVTALIAAVKYVWGKGERGVCGFDCGCGCNCVRGCL